MELVTFFEALVPRHCHPAPCHTECWLYNRAGRWLDSTRICLGMLAALQNVLSDYVQLDCTSWVMHGVKAFWCMSACSAQDHWRFGLEAPSSSFSSRYHTPPTYTPPSICCLHVCLVCIIPPCNLSYPHSSSVLLIRIKQTYFTRSGGHAVYSTLRFINQTKLHQLYMRGR